MIGRMSGFEVRNSAGSDAGSEAQQRAAIVVTSKADAIVVTASGEIDMSSAPAFDEAVRQALTEQPAKLILDLTNVEFFSSAGIAVLMQAHRNSSDAVRVVVTNRIVLRPLELVGLTDDLTIYPSVQAALEG